MRISDWSSDVCSSDLGNLTCGAQFNIAILDLRKNQANSSQPFLVAPLHGGGLGSFDLVANHRALSSSCLETHSYSGIKLILIGLTLDHEKPRSEEHTSELQSLMRISYAVFCLKKKI